MQYTCLDFREVKIVSVEMLDYKHRILTMSYLILFETFECIQHKQSLQSYLRLATLPFKWNIVNHRCHFHLFFYNDLETNQWKPWNDKAHSRGERQENEVFFASLLPTVVCYVSNVFMNCSFLWNSFLKSHYYVLLLILLERNNGSKKEMKNHSLAYLLVL